jgi:hypothetical protein
MTNIILRINEKEDPVEMGFEDEKTVSVQGLQDINYGLYLTFIEMCKSCYYNPSNNQDIDIKFDLQEDGVVAALVMPEVAIH